MLAFFRVKRFLNQKNEPLSSLMLTMIPTTIVEFEIVM